MTKDDWKKVLEATGFIARFQDSVIPAVLILLALVALVASFPLLGWLFGPSALTLGILVAAAIGLIVHSLWELYEIWASGDGDDDDEEGGSGDDLGPPASHSGELRYVH